MCPRAQSWVPFSSLATPPPPLALSYVTTTSSSTALQMTPSSTSPANQILHSLSLKCANIIINIQTYSKQEIIVFRGENIILGFPCSSLKKTLPSSQHLYFHVMKKSRKIFPYKKTSPSQPGWERQSDSTEQNSVGGREQSRTTHD